MVSINNTSNLGSTEDGSHIVLTCCNMVCRCRLFPSTNAAYTHRDIAQLLACRSIFDEATENFVYDVSRFVPKPCSMEMLIRSNG